VLHAIKTYLRLNDRPPTVRDLCQQTGITSTSYVYLLLAGLELDGYITREPGVSRSIRLNRSRGIPIVGRIAAGEPLDHFDTGTPEILDLAAHTYGSDGGLDGDSESAGAGVMKNAEYVLRVYGESMIEDGIFDGDYVLVRPGHTAPQGAVVVAEHLDSDSGEHGAATLKRLHIDRKHKRVLLCPANAALQPRTIPMAVWDREWVIQGTVTAIYRSFGR
jgi:repressor LexA